MSKDEKAKVRAFIARERSKPARNKPFKSKLEQFDLSLVQLYLKNFSFASLSLYLKDYENIYIDQSTIYRYFRRKHRGLIREARKAGQSSHEIPS